MSANAIKSLTIKHLRGSVQTFNLTFEKNRSLTVIYGENGCGKSTICDALEFIGSGNVGSLDNRGLGRTSQYWSTLGKGAKDVSVTLETNSHTCTATIASGTVTCSPPQNRPRIEVLRRSEILALVITQPSQRYEAIKRFIDVTEFESSEARLKELIGTQHNDMKLALERYSESVRTIESFWETDGKHGSDALSWANEEILAPTELLNKHILALTNLDNAYSALTNLRPTIKSAEESVDQALQGVNLARARFQDSIGKVADGADQLVDLLESARGYLEKNKQIEKCPLCESTEFVINLKDQVDLKLVSLSELRKARAILKAAEGQFSTCQNTLNTLKSRLKKEIELFTNSINSDALPDQIVQEQKILPTDGIDLNEWESKTLPLRDKWRKLKASNEDKRKFIET